MRVQVVALDFDGTIAVDGVLDAGVRAAIAAARAQGLTVVLVTGRILADLHRVLPDLSIFDAIVAENGAVLLFPVSGRWLLLAAPPPPTFLDELRRRHLPCLAGECVVEADAVHAPPILEVIRDMQLPLVIQFNRGRAMVLPQAVSKATGLREVLHALRLSPHDAVGVGDAENDHELLTCCEVGVAAGWGSPALRAVADEILVGDGPSAVAGWLRALVDAPWIDPDRLDRRRIHVGVRDDGGPFSLAIRGRNLLIAGDTGSGKSWLAGFLCEQLVLARYCVCVIDPEGEYRALQGLPSVVVFDADPQPPQIDDVERALRYPDISAVFDLSAMEVDARLRYVRELLARLRDLRRRVGVPHAIVVDEAQYFLGDPSLSRCLDLGGGGYVLVSWHASQVSPEVLAAAHTVLATCTSERAEADALHRWWGGDQDPDVWFARLRSLAPDCAVLLPGEGGELVRFRVASRFTAHVRHREKYLNQRVAAERAFLLRDGETERCRAQSLAELVAGLATRPDVRGHLRRGDISRWVRDVFQQRELADRLACVERAWSEGGVADPLTSLAHVIRVDASADEAIVAIPRPAGNEPNGHRAPPLRGGSRAGDEG